MTDITEEELAVARAAYREVTLPVYPIVPANHDEGLRAALTAAFASRPSQGGQWVGRPANFAGWRDQLLLLTDQISNGEIADAGATVEEMLEGFDDVIETESAPSAAGYVIVPRIETDAMCEAGLEALRENLGHSAVIMRDAAACYRAMVHTAEALSASPSPYAAEVRPAGHFHIAHDDFAGDVIGHYTTREGKPGVVLQQDGTRVVHVYGLKWLTAKEGK